MNCIDFRHSLDDYMDDTLASAARAAMQAHHDQCLSCQDELQQARHCQQALRSLPTPNPGPDFFQQAIQHAAAVHRRRSLLRYTGFGGAIAAGLLMFALNLPLLLPTAVDPAQHSETPLFTIALHETRDVRLVFHAEQALEGAQFTLQLPPQVELRGFPDQQQISWTGSLKQGENLLALPITARLAGSGSLSARLEHQGKSQEFTVDLISEELQQSRIHGQSFV